MALEIHLFHGFLGNSSDWNQVTSIFDKKYEVIVHNLLEDCTKLDSIDFDSWKSLKEDQINSNNSKVLVGYSLGGRLGLHLNNEIFDKTILLGSHPGLSDDTSMRLQNDKDWVERSKELDQEQWLELWNSQEVFANDNIRPKRSFSSEEFSLWIKLLEGFSLARQNNFFNHSFENLYWGYGERDKKFSSLKSKIEDWIPKKNVFEVPESGHGVIFDNPQFVASVINEVCSDIS